MEKSKIPFLIEMYSQYLEIPYLEYQVTKSGYLHYRPFVRFLLWDVGGDDLR